MQNPIQLRTPANAELLVLSEIVKGLWDVVLLLGINASQQLIACYDNVLLNPQDEGMRALEVRACQQRCCLADEAAGCNAAKDWPVYVCSCCFCGPQIIKSDLRLLSHVNQHSTLQGY